MGPGNLRLAQGRGSRNRRVRARAQTQQSRSGDATARVTRPTDSLRPPCSMPLWHPDTGSGSRSGRSGPGLRLALVSLDRVRAWPSRMTVATQGSLARLFWARGVGGAVVGRRSAGPLPLPPCCSGPLPPLPWSMFPSLFPLPVLPLPPSADELCGVGVHVGVRCRALSNHSPPWHSIFPLSIPSSSSILVSIKRPRTTAPLLLLLPLLPARFAYPQQSSKSSSLPTQRNPVGSHPIPATYPPNRPVASLSPPDQEPSRVSHGLAHPRDGLVMTCFGPCFLIHLPTVSSPPRTVASPL